MDGYMILASALVGVLVGLTGAGGGAVMTPMLVSLFSVRVPAAISADLVASLAMRPFGAAVHVRRGTVDGRMVARLALGSVPAALAGSYLLHLLEGTRAGPAGVRAALGATLLLGAAAMAVRHAGCTRAGRRGPPTPVTPGLRSAATVAVGVVGGLLVGMTSVGSGSLMVVLLMSLYPGLPTARVVGTDLVQAVPLTVAAALGALAFGHVQLPLTAAVAVGGAPGAVAGSLLSSRVPESWLRSAVLAVVAACGLRYTDLPGVYPLVGAMALVAATAGVSGLARRYRTDPAGLPAEPCVSTRT